jgi:hypothetical protein
VTLKKNDRHSEEIHKKVDLQKLTEIFRDPRKFVSPIGTKTSQKENIVTHMSSNGQNQSMQDALKEIRENTANYSLDCFISKCK